jgi:hypothetical protein
MSNETSTILNNLNLQTLYDMNYLGIELIIADGQIKDIIYPETKVR